jgi:catechol 2,3-dioxygenase-like lactoylglutathione lyase family enzyme
VVFFLGVDAIYGAGIDAGSVLCPDAGFGNDVGHGPPPPSLSTLCLPEGTFKRKHGKLLAYGATIEKISAVTFRVLSMKASVQFYRDVLGMELVYGGERAGFSSLRAKDPDSAILNLEQGRLVSGWGQLIFHVADMDAFWAYLCEKEFHPERPRDAPWGERYFHMPDPDGHELSFARPI